MIHPFLIHVGQSLVAILTLSSSHKAIVDAIV